MKDQVELNKIGIFQVDGENYVKQFKSNGRPYLKSLNPDYDDVFLSEDDEIRTIGEVVEIYSDTEQSSTSESSSTETTEQSSEKVAYDVAEMNVKISDSFNESVQFNQEGADGYEWTAF